MFHWRKHAKETPNKPAYIMGESGMAVTYKELEERANQCSHYFKKIGLQQGDRGQPVRLRRLSAARCGYHLGQSLAQMVPGKQRRSPLGCSESAVVQAGREVGVHSNR